MEAAGLHEQQAKPDTLPSGAATEDAATLNSSFLEFLNDELVFGSEALDPATLEAVCEVANSQRQAVCGGGTTIKPEQLTTAKSAPAGGHAPAMKRPFEDPCPSDSDDEDEVGKGEKSTSKRAKGGEMSAAATKKACREKARREKLNERFLDLARLVDPSSEPKTDKSTVLTDAIKYVQQITVENHQLRQLNKFLEERVSALERERGQQLYQQSLMMTAMGQGQMVQGGQAMLVGAPQGMMTAAPGLPGSAMPHPHAQLAMPGPAMAAAGGSMLSAAGLPSNPTPPLPALQAPQQQPAAGGLLVHSASNGLLAASQQQPGGMLAQQQAGGMMVQGPGGLVAQAAGGMMAQMSVPGGPQPAAGGMGYGVAMGGMGPGPSKPVMVNAMPGVLQYQAGMYWLPPQVMDSTQDSLLRPPAA